MTVYLFPDNTVLCNFAAVDRLDLLQAVLNARGRWTGAVAYEAELSSRHLTSLRTIDMREWLGPPIEITDEPEVQRVQRIRRVVFGGTDHKPLQHLGEAETCFLLKERDEFAGAVWISDDREALRYARFQGIRASETIDLMVEANGNGDVTPQAAFDLMRGMADAGRGVRLPNSVREMRA